MSALDNPRPHVSGWRACDCCNGWGYDYTYPFNPSRKPHKVVCLDCGGKGFIPISYSGMTPDSGAAADPAVHQKGDDTYHFLSNPEPIPDLYGSGYFKIVDDLLRVAAGFALFSLVAWFFWVLA